MGPSCVRDHNVIHENSVRGAFGPEPPPSLAAALNTAATAKAELLYPTPCH